MKFIDFAFTIKKWILNWKFTFIKIKPVAYYSIVTSVVQKNAINTKNKQKETFPSFIKKTTYPVFSTS